MKYFTGFFFGFLFILASCTRDELKSVTLEGETQGTYYSVKYYCVDQRNYKPQVDSLLGVIDRSVSLWDPTSVLSRVNNNDTAVVLDQVFIDLFGLSRQVSDATGGAFDITVGALVDAWGFGASGKRTMEQRVVDSLLRQVGYKAVRIENNRLTREKSGIRLDFNAIAQGYSVDVIARFFDSKGIENYLIDVGGEVFARGTKPGDAPWRVGIENPPADKDAGRELKATVNLSGKALATSGNYRKYYEENGIRYSHTIDPATGYPVRHSLLSATVMAANAALADAYATAFMVMGVEKTRDFLSAHSELDAFLIYQGKGGSNEVFATRGMQSLIETDTISP
jgi:thiamine biosynthesis lipoprotein